MHMLYLKNQTNQKNSYWCVPSVAGVTPSSGMHGSIDSKANRSLLGSVNIAIYGLGPLEYINLVYNNDHCEDIKGWWPIFSPFPTFRFRLSDFPTFPDHSPALPTVYYYIIIPPPPTSSDEVWRGPWPCSATFGAVHRDHECHLHEAKSAQPFREITLFFWNVS